MEQDGTTEATTKARHISPWRSAKRPVWVCERVEMRSGDAADAQWVYAFRDEGEDAPHACAGFFFTSGRSGLARSFWKDVKMGLTPAPAGTGCGACIGGRDGTDDGCGGACA